MEAAWGSLWGPRVVSWEVSPVPCRAPAPSAHPSLDCAFPTARFNSEEVCTCPQASVPEQFASVPWNSFSRHVLAALYGFAPVSVHCNKSSAIRFQVCRLAGARGAGRAPPGAVVECRPLCVRGSLGPTGPPARSDRPPPSGELAQNRGQLAAERPRHTDRGTRREQPTWAGGCPLSGDNTSPKWCELCAGRRQRPRSLKINRGGGRDG